jgi:uncharacterized delta-60 repeat protein
MNVPRQYRHHPRPRQKHSGTAIGGQLVNPRATQAKIGANLNTKHRAIFAALLKYLGLFVAVAFLVPLVAKAAPGDLDPTFGEGGKKLLSGTAFNAGTLAPQDRIYAAGSCSNSTEAHFCLVRLHYDGDLDLSFGDQGVVIAEMGGIGSYAIGVHVDDRLGKILLGGSCHEDGGVITFCALRLDSNGAIDDSFGAGGRVAYSFPGIVTDKILGFFRDLIGNLYFAGQCNQRGKIGFCAIKLKSDGRLDLEYGNDGILFSELVEAQYAGGTFASSASLRSDGSVMIGGYCYTGIVDHRACIARYTTQGRLDTSFQGVGYRFIDVSDFLPSPYANPAGVLAIKQLAVGGGSYIALGCAWGFKADLCVAKLDESGNIVPAFGGNGLLALREPNGDEIATSIAVYADELFVTSSCPGLTSGDICVRQFHRDSGLSVTFGANGRTGVDFDGRYDRAVVVGGDRLRKITLVGTCSARFGEQPIGCLARLKGGPYDATICSLNADLNNQVAGNDGVLAIRYLLGYTGDALTDGVLGANPGRTAQQVESHLAQLKAAGKLDVDGDGEANALTDGLLILRVMLGLSGDALFAGARNASHPNVRDAKQILQWIEATHGVACLP